LKTYWTRENPNLRYDVIASANEVWRRLDEYKDGSYVNYIDPLLENWSEEYYGSNYEKLNQMKSQIDPNRLFWFPQAIGSQ